MPNELTNPNNVVTEERLAQFYQQILPYLGGMPDILANKFNRADLYSTDEKMIGRWIDGKPLYQKTVTIDSLPNATTTEYDVGLTNVSYVNISGYILFSSGNKSTIPHVDVTNVNSGIAVQGNTNGKVAVAVRADRRSCSAVITLQYTKTTDSAVDIGSDTDYSTTEKIVGTWIDGKPIWQKTVSFGALPNNSTKDVAHDISNIDNITAYYAISSNASGTSFVIPFAFGGGTTAVNPVACSVDKTSIHVWCFDNRTAYINTYVTIQYTKTSS